MSRLRAIALPILAVAINSCSDPLTPSDEPRTVSFTTLINSNRYFELASQPAYVVLRGRNDEEQFLTSYPRDTSYSSSGEPSVESFPVVDYDRQLVVGLALGRRGAGNTEVTIDSLVIDGLQLHVYSTELDPCIELRYFSNPAHFVAIDRVDLGIDFVPTQVVEAPCN